MIKINEINNTEIKNDINNDDSDSGSDMGDYLKFIKINSKNKIEEISKEEHIQQLIAFSKVLKLESEDNVGQEMNKFFNLILSENKEGEPLKVNIAISNRLYKDNNINNAIDIILNKKERSYIILTKELCENISLLLTNSYKKIKNKGKIKNFNELLEKINSFNFSEKDILKKYLINKDNKTKKNKNNEIYLSPPKNKDFTVKINGRFNFSEEKKSNKELDKSMTNIEIIDDYININNSEKNMKVIANIKNEDKNYKFKVLRDDNKLEIPPEMLILRRKFQTVKKMKLILNNNYRIRNKSYYKFSSNNTSEMNNSMNDSKYNWSQIDNDYILKKKDVDNSIFVLLNLSWLFPQLIEIDVDLSNEDLIKDQISLYKSGLMILTDLLKRNLKKTDYHSDIFKDKINFDPLRGSIFPSNNQSNEEEESSENDSDSYSLEITEIKENTNTNTNNSNNELIINNNINENDVKNNNLINEDNNKNLMNNLDNFINKYQYTLQMIIIYGYFTSKIPNLFFCNYILPINLEREIIRMLQIHGICFADFNFLSFLSDIRIVNITYDFNSLDNKAFQHILSLLDRNNNLHVCQLNFFPSENYIESELLFKILQDSNNCYKSSCLNKYNTKIYEELLPNEDIDIFLLKKLSGYFETNIDKLFQTICFKSIVSELSLIFNYPLILNKIDYYLIIILKFIINLFIAIDNGKIYLTSFILQANNFSLDSRKYPFLIEFFEKITIFSNKELRLSKLIYQMKFININNIYRIIPYNITELSLGEFDYETFVYFAEYITSDEFSIHSKLSKLKIKLSNNILCIDNIYDYLLILLTEYPKNLKEISVDTYLSITLEQLNTLLKCTNYNTIQNIFMTFSKKSLNDKGYEGKIKNDINNISKENILDDENYINIKYVIRTNRTVNIIKNNIMMNLSLKYNKRFMEYNIFKCLEKFYCKNCNKKYLIQFK